MERKNHFYVSRKSLLTWLMVLCMVCSAVTRILFIGVKGPDLWSQIVLPIGASLLFVLIVLLAGKEYFFKTAIPVWLIHLYYFFFFRSLDFGVVDGLMTLLYAVTMIFISVFYTQVTCGKVRAMWPLLFLLLVPIVCRLYINRVALITIDYAELKSLLPDALLTASLISILFGLQVHPVDEYHPSWGDRIDGRRIRTEPPMNQFAPYVMDSRMGACNYFAESLEITQVERYIRQKRREGMTGFGLTHVLLACYCRTLCKYPAVNRFISGQKIYTHGKDIQFCMIIKKELNTSAPETLLKLHLSPTDTVDDIYRKFNTEVQKLKNTPLDSSFDKTAQALMMIPGVCLKFTVWVLKVLDYFGLLPKFLLEVSPFHGSVFFTSMGSLGIPPVYHHLYNFGNLPVFASFGCKRRVAEVTEDGTLTHRKYMDVKFSIDDRIVDGFYCASFFKHFKRLFHHPELLEQSPQEVKRDID